MADARARPAGSGPRPRVVRTLAELDTYGPMWDRLAPGAGNPVAEFAYRRAWAGGLGDGQRLNVLVAGGAIAPLEADGALVQFPLLKNVLPVGVEAAWCFPFSCSSFPVYQVTYAGPAPYLVAGISQINFQVVPFSGLNAVVLPSAQSPYFGIFVASK